MVLTYKQQFNKKYNQPLNQPNSLNDIQRLTGIKKRILQEVYNRGVGAWENNIESVRLKSGKKDYSVKDRSKKMSKERWAMARVYSFIGGGKTQKTTDADLWKQR
jgi:hypothetical protein